MTALNYPLSNAQLELLKLFANDIPDEELIDLKRLIVKYYAKKLEEKATKIWEEKNWTDEDMDKFLNTHMRTPYKKSSK